MWCRLLLCCATPLIGSVLFCSNVSCLVPVLCGSWICLLSAALCLLLLAEGAPWMGHAANSPGLCQTPWLVPRCSALCCAVRSLPACLLSAMYCFVPDGAMVTQP